MTEEALYIILWTRVAKCVDVRIFSPSVAAVTSCFCFIIVAEPLPAAVSSSIRCGGQNSLEAESLQPNFPFGERINDDEQPFCFRALGIVSVVLSKCCTSHSWRPY